MNWVRMDVLNSTVVLSSIHIDEVKRYVVNDLYNFKQQDFDLIYILVMLCRKLSANQANYIH